MAGIAQRGALGSGAPVLPDDGAVERSPRRAIEGHDGLPLVGEADGDRPLAAFGQASAHLAECAADVLPDLSGVVLYPTGLGEVLRELSVGAVDHVPALVDGQCAHARRSGVDRKDGRHRRGDATDRREGLSLSGSLPISTPAVDRPLTPSDGAGPTGTMRCSSQPEGTIWGRRWCASGSPQADRDARAATRVVAVGPKIVDAV